MVDFRLATKIHVYYIKDAFGKQQKIIPLKFNRQFTDKHKTHAYFDVPRTIRSIPDDMICVVGVDVLNGIADKEKKKR